MTTTSLDFLKIFWLRLNASTEFTNYNIVSSRHKMLKDLLSLFCVFWGLSILLTFKVITLGFGCNHNHQCHTHKGALRTHDSTDDHAKTALTSVSRISQWLLWGQFLGSGGGPSLGSSLVPKAILWNNHTTWSDNLLISDSHSYRSNKSSHMSWGW